MQSKLERVQIVEDIRNSLLSEVQTLCITLDKTKAEAEDKLKRSTKNFNEIIHFLNRGFETERLGFLQTSELLRKLESNLRDSHNHLQNFEATNEVLQAELKKNKSQLHKCQEKLRERETELRKMSFRAKQLEEDLFDSVDRAEFAEKALKNYRHK